MAKFFTPTKLSENIRETPEGFLFCLDVPIARTGWQDYGQGETPLEVGEDGIVKIYRSPEEVFRPQTIASFQGKSVTIKHPKDFVVPENWKELSKGSAQNVRKGTEKDADGEESLYADLLITESTAIQLVKMGLREVSCGYECEYEQTGEGEGRQFNIVGNHIALVEEGRAGTAYAINDHKGKVNMDPKKLLEMFKKKFGAKAVDEAMAEEKKEDKEAKDEEKEKADKEAKDAGAYDELIKMVKDMGEKLDGMKSSKDEKEEPKKEEKSEEKDDKADGDEEKKAKDDDQATLESRMSALEAAVAKLCKQATGDEDEESEESEDEESEEESEDDDFENSEMTGDTAARVEILAPGVKAVKGKDVRVQALETAYGTKEGKAVIEVLTGGKKPVFDSAEKISAMFIAASECLKNQRGNGLSQTKDGAGFEKEKSESQSGFMTAEKQNEINAAHWARK